MYDTVYRGYTQAELDAQYNARSAVPAFGAFVQRWISDSEDAVEMLPSTPDVAYGDGPVEILDIFHPLGGGPAPVLMFFHGGYWRAGDKSWFRYLARPFVERGAAFVAVKYGLCPDHKMDELVVQCRRAVAWVFRNIEDHGGDSARLFVSGHSAGGHITGMMLGTDWVGEFGLPADAIKGAVGISGLYDLEPIRLSQVNGPLQLSAEDAKRNSPLHHKPRVAPPPPVLLVLISAWLLAMAVRIASFVERSAGRRGDRVSGDVADSSSLRSQAIVTPRQPTRMLSEAIEIDVVTDGTESLEGGSAHQRRTALRS